MNPQSEWTSDQLDKLAVATRGQLAYETLSYEFRRCLSEMNCMMGVGIPDRLAVHMSAVMRELKECIMVAEGEIAHAQHIQEAYEDIIIRGDVSVGGFERALADIKDRERRRREQDEPQ